jgi:zinc D-Ala-D-Ala dipeptidase
MHTTPLEELRQYIKESGCPSPALALEQLLNSSTGRTYRRHVPIRDCGESLEELPIERFLRNSPHPYQSAGAPYDGVSSPFFVRTSVLRGLEQAQQILQERKPGFRIKIYDAFRPLSVQKYMVALEFRKLAHSLGHDPDTIAPDVESVLMEQVYTLWAKPTEDPRCPPPHSTGAAVDVTLVDETGLEVDMGCKIDILGSVSLPNYFAAGKDESSITYQQNRELLNDIMSRAGLRRLPYEWWHFSYGDQMWALLQWLDNHEEPLEALYGRLKT